MADWTVYCVYEVVHKRLPISGFAVIQRRSEGLGECGSHRAALARGVKIHMQIQIVSVPACLKK